MKILQLVTRSEPGGAQTIVRTLAEALSERGHDVLVASGPEGDGEAWKGMSDRVGIAVLPHLVRSLSPGEEFKAIAEISALYRSFRPDCVNLHTSKAALLGRLAPGLARSRIVYTMHGFDQLRVANRRFLAADKILKRLCGAVVAVSSQDEMTMRKEGYAPVLIPNGTVDSCLRLKEDDLVRSRLDELRSSGLPLVLTVARDAKPKRLDLVRELSRLFRGRASFAWIGGDSHNRCPDGSRGTGIPGWIDAGDQPGGFRAPGAAGGRVDRDNLICLGTVPDAAAYLSEVDVFILASDHEGMPVSLVEAMSAGLPCIASDVGGIPELLGEDCGMVVPNTVGDFAIGLEKLIASPELRRELGGSARKAWEERYSVGRMAEAYEVLYRRCAGPAGPANPAGRS